MAYVETERESVKGYIFEREREDEGVKVKVKVICRAERDRGKRVGKEGGKEEVEEEEKVGFFGV